MWPNVGHGWRTGRWTNGRSGHLTRIMCHERKWLTRHPSHRMFGKMQRTTPLQPLRLAWQKEERHTAGGTAYGLRMDSAPKKKAT